MQEGQKLEYIYNGRQYQVALFPLSCVNVSQDENVPPTHLGTYNMDFLGMKNIDGTWERVFDCPYYAPVDIRLVTTRPSQHWNIWNSLEKVIMPNGIIDYLSIYCVHDETLPTEVGMIRRQGEIFGHTGTAGYVTGDHVHLNIARGLHSSLIHVEPDNRANLPDSVHIYEGLFVNDTYIYNGRDHNWVTFEGGFVPAGSGSKGYKFFKYRNKQKFWGGYYNGYY